MLDAKTRFMLKTTISKRLYSGTPCIEWSGFRRSKGYGHFWLNGGCRSSHRASWVLFNGKIPRGAQVLHHCDNPPCVNPDHLFIGSNTSNVADKMSKNRHRAPRGEEQGLSKLTDKKVIKIRELRNKRVTLRRLADKFKVSPSTIAQVVTRKTWRHL